MRGTTTTEGFVLVDVVSVVCRALSFITLLQAAGLAMFRALFGSELVSTDPRLRTYGICAALLGALFVAAHYVLEAGRMSGELAGVLDPSLQALVMLSPASVAFTWRLAGLILIVVGLRVSGAAGTTIGLLGAMLALAAFAQVGHTAADPDRGVTSLFLLTHLLAVAFWYGALVPLYVITGHETLSTAARVASRFSAFAVWLIPMLFVAGLILAALLLGSVTRLATPYGQLLLAKIAGFAVLIVLASINRWRLVPGLERGSTYAHVAFRRSVLAEMLLVTAVLCITAVLTTFYSPRD
ncbi:MAG: CopD family protein [Steroidobacteraceae bacterium]|nr:CopD family protein [Steroidobacteraceae bacterium]